nr:retrovirus-related Pol polyprotein from transposon TNT 1-94 [Tanacetum cinerariifolium]
VEPKKVFDALQDLSWVEAMQEDLLQFKIQKVWTLVDCPKGVRPIGIKWVFKNKKDERGIVVRNKARLVVQGHTQEEGIDYDEVFAPVARIEAIRLFLAYASFMGFIVYQMDVKSAFLYGTIDEEVYVMQPPGFQDLAFPVKVYKLEKAIKPHDKSSTQVPEGSENPNPTTSSSNHPVEPKKVFDALQDLSWVEAMQEELLQFKIQKVWTLVDCPKGVRPIGIKWVFKNKKDERGIVVRNKARLVVQGHTQEEGIDYDEGEFNSNFHPMVDFIAASPLRYALTVKPAIFVSHIRQFWSTARIETKDEETHILATVDGIQRTVSESSLRRNLKLKDEGGIVSIPDTELFENLTLMGTPTEPHHTPFPEADTSHTTTSSILLPSLPTAPIPLVTLPDPTPIRQYTRKARIARSSALPTVANEPAYPIRDVSKGEAYPTESGFIADQNRATIAKSSTWPHNSAPRVTSPAADEGKDREGVTTKQSRDDAPIKGRSINEGEAAAERISNDSEDVARFLTSMDAATIPAGGIDVPTGSGSISTAGPPTTIISTGSEVGPTASPIVTPYSRRKGKEVMMVSNTLKKKKLQEQIDAQVASELEKQQEKEDMRMNEQIARDAEVARIHAEEEIQGMIDSLDRSNETTAKYLQEYQEFASELPLEKRIELIKITEEKMKELMQLVPVEDVYVQALQVKHPIIDWKVHIEGQRSYWKIIRLGGSSACYQFFVDLLKQLDMEDLNQLWALVKEYLSIRLATSEKEMELWVELKRMYEPDPEDQLWTMTHNFMHAHVEWKLYDLSGVHHLTAKDKEIFMLVEKDYPLRKGLALVMISYKLQVKNYSQMAEDLIIKIYNIANTLRRSIKFRGGLLGIKCTRHSHCQVKSSHWQYKFLLPVKIVANARRIKMPLPEVCTAIEEKKKKLPVKDRWQLH